MLRVNHHQLENYLQELKPIAHQTLFSAISQLNQEPSTPLFQLNQAAETEK